MTDIKLNKFNLTGRRVLVKLSDNPDMKGDIHIPQTAQEKRKNGREAIVIQTGISDEPFEMEPGDRVIVHQHAGSPVEIEDHKLLIVRPEEDVLAILTTAA